MLGNTEIDSGEELSFDDPGVWSEVVRSRQRFTRWVVSAVLISIVPYLWVLFWMWNNSPSVLRNAYSNGYGENFYDLQSRAILSGHLYVPNGSLAIEAWTHDGHQYTYFGIFP